MLHLKRLALGLIVTWCVGFFCTSHFAAAAQETTTTGRCNDRVAGALEAQVTNWERHPPADRGIDAAFVSLQWLIADLSQEDEVLAAMCSSKDLAGLRTSIRSSEALAYLLQSDLAKRKYATCPDAQNKVAAGYIASAWLALERSIPEDATPDPDNEMAGKVRERANGAGLKLVPLEQASNYWVGQVQAAAQKALAGCSK